MKNTNEIVLHPTPEQIEAHNAECRAKGWTVITDSNSIEAKMFDKDVEIEGLYELIYGYITSTRQQQDFSQYLMQEVEDDKQRDWREKKWALDLQWINSGYKDEGIDRTCLLRKWINELIGFPEHSQAIPLTNGEDVEISWIGKSSHDEDIFEVDICYGIRNTVNGIADLLDQLSYYDIDYIKMADVEEGE